MKIKFLLINLIILLSISVSLYPAAEQEFHYYLPLIIRDDSRVLIYLPDDYYSTDKRYPVLYFQDGELVYGKFSADFIVVCIKNTDRQIARWNYLSPWIQYHMDNWWPGVPSVLGGDGEDYLNYILHTKSWIDQRYRTLSDREHTAIGGFSMGGLFSVYAGLERPEIFSKVIALSPAVWFGSRSPSAWLDQNNLIDYINQTGNPDNVEFYFYVGGNEYHDNGYPLIGGDYPDIYKKGVYRLYNLLGGKLVFDPLGKHTQAVFINKLPAAFQWLGW